MWRKGSTANLDEENEIYMHLGLLTMSLVCQTGKVLTALRLSPSLRIEAGRPDEYRASPTNAIARNYRLDRVI